MAKSRSGRRLVQASAEYDQIQKEIDGRSTKERGEAKYLALSQTRNRPTSGRIIAAFRDAVGDAADQLDDQDVENVRRALDWAHSNWMSNESAPNIAKAEKRLIKIRDAAVTFQALIARTNDPDPFNAFIARTLRTTAHNILGQERVESATYTLETAFFERLLSELRIIELAAQAGLREVSIWGVGHPGAYIGHLDQLMADIEHFVFSPKGWRVTVVTNRTDRHAPLAIATFRLGRLLLPKMWPDSENAMISLLKKRRSKAKDRRRPQRINS